MAESDLLIRAALPADAVALAEIYAHHVLHGTGTFEEEPPSPGEMAARLNAVRQRGWPWLVAERDKAVIGYAYCGQYRDRAAYRYAGEDSLYIRNGFEGRGVGTALLVALMAQSKAAGFRQMVAVIGDSANAASIAIHARHGFAHVGLLRDVGFKFGRSIDVVHMQRSL